MPEQPRRGLVVGNHVCVTVEQLHVVNEITGVVGFEFIQCLARVFRERVAVKAAIVRTRLEIKREVAAVFRRRVFQWFASCHWASACKVIAKEGSKTLAAVCPFGNADKVDGGGVDITRHERLAQQLFPGPKFGALIPAIVFLIRYLGNEICRRRIVVLLCQQQAVAPFCGFCARTVQRKEEGKTVGRLLRDVLRAIVKRHHGVGFQICGQLPRTCRHGVEGLQGGKFFFFKIIICIDPRLPHFLCGIGTFALAEYAVGRQRCLVACKHIVEITLEFGACFALSRSRQGARKESGGGREGREREAAEKHCRHILYI